MIRNSLLIVLALAIMVLVAIAVAFWSDLSLLRHTVQGNGSAGLPYAVAIVDDPFDWLALWQLIVAVLAILVGFGSVKFWEVYDRRQAEKRALAKEAVERLRWMANARRVASEGAGQILYAALVGFGREVPQFLGTPQGFQRRWSHWIAYRVSGLILELGALDDMLIGEFDLGVARLTLLARLQWLSGEGGRLVERGDPNRDLLARAVRDARISLAQFIQAEEQAALAAGQTVQLDRRSGAIATILASFSGEVFGDQDEG